MFCENRGRMTRRKSICVVKICTPREVHEGVMRGHAANVLPPWTSCVESFKEALLE